METVSQLLAERDAAEAEEKRTFAELCDEVRKTAVALEATQQMLRVALGNYVAITTNNADVGISIINGCGLPDRLEVTPWVHDALKVLGQRATEALQ
jgi:hypothetical protein